MGAWQQVCRSAELLPGEFRCVDVEDVAVAVYNIDGNFYAIEDVCTHDGGELAGGAIEGFAVECLRHGAKFDLRTGAALCAPAHVPTAVMEVKNDQGMLWVRDPRW